MRECGQTRDIVRRWTCGETLARKELEGVLEHCRHCSECSGVYAAILPFVERDAGGRTVGESLEPSASFTDELMGRVRGTAGRRRTSGRRSSRGLRWALAAAAGLLLVLGIGFAAFRLTAVHRSDEVVVRFQLAAPGAKSVAVVGSFTGWRESKMVMSDPDRNGIFEISVRLRKGSVYTYNFLIDGHVWVLDPQADAQVDDGFGGRSSVLSL